MIVEKSLNRLFAVDRIYYTNLLNKKIASIVINELYIFIFEVKENETDKSKEDMFMSVYTQDNKEFFNTEITNTVDNIIEFYQKHDRISQSYDTNSFINEFNQLKVYKKEYIYIETVGMSYNFLTVYKAILIHIFFLCYKDLKEYRLAQKTYLNLLDGNEEELNFLSKYDLNKIILNPGKYIKYT